MDEEGDGNEVVYGEKFVKVFFVIIFFVDYEFLLWNVVVGN